MTRREFFRALSVAGLGGVGTAAAQPTIEPVVRPTPLRALRRSATYARRGMVVSSQPLASQVGLDVLRNGGSASDAAIAASAVLCVLDPVTTGIGGQLRGMIFDSVSKEAVALRSVGRSVGSVAVPGCIDGWVSLHGRFGRRPFADLLATAADLAESGVVISARTATHWSDASARLAVSDDPAIGHALLPGGAAPEPGQVVTRPDLAGTLRLIALRGRAALYQGDLATPLLRALNDRASTKLTADELATQNAEWLALTSIDYRGRAIASVPDAAVLLQTLLLLTPYRIGEMEPDSPAFLHLLVEAFRLADATDAPREQRLQRHHNAMLRRQINPNIARPRGPVSDAAQASGSVVAVDQNGNWCVLANSVGQPFGSGHQLAGTGLLLPSSVSQPTPLPLLVFDRGEPVLAASVSGPGQPGLVAARLLSSLVDFDQPLPDVIDAFRLRLKTIDRRVRLSLEPAVSNESLQGLLRRGHDVSRMRDWNIGRALVVERRPIRGTLIAAADVRGDAAAVGF